MEKTKKDELTVENIKNDLIRYAKASFWNNAGWISLIIWITCLSILFGVLSRRFLIGAIVFLFAIYPIIKLVCEIIRMKKKIDLINQGNFTVTKDTLTNIAIERVREMSVSSRSTSVEATFLWFGAAKWRLLFQKYYTWSETYNISPRGILNTSLIGNEFFIVLVGPKQEIMHVYNTKFFVWNG